MADIVPKYLTLPRGCLRAEALNARTYLHEPIEAGRQAPCGVSSPISSKSIVNTPLPSEMPLLGNQVLRSNLKDKVR